MKNKKSRHEKRTGGNGPSFARSSETGGKSLSTSNLTTPRLKTQSPSLATLDKLLSKMERAKNPAEFLQSFGAFLAEIEAHHG